MPNQASSGGRAAEPSFGSMRQCETLTQGLRDQALSLTEAKEQLTMSWRELPGTLPTSEGRREMPEELEVSEELERAMARLGPGPRGSLSQEVHRLCHRAGGRSIAWKGETSWGSSLRRMPGS